MPGERTRRRAQRQFEAGGMKLFVMDHNQCILEIFFPIINVISRLLDMGMKMFYCDSTIR
jgi:hypothetical protein